MDDRRLTRKEPLEIEVPSLNTKINIGPVKWRVRGDLGTAIQTEFSRALEAAREGAGGRDPNNLMDYSPVLQKGTSLTQDQIEELTFSEVVNICHWICEMNGLESLLWMLDPEARAPQLLQEIGAAQEDGPKTSSTEDSSSPESNPTT